MKLIRVCLLVVVVFGYLANAQSVSKPQKPFEPQRPKPQEPQKPTPSLPRPYKPSQKPSDPQKPKLPQKPGDPQVPQPDFLACDVDPAYRIQCGPTDVSQAECETLNCCFDGRSCYYGKYVTVQCTKAGYFIVVVARDVTLPGIDLESIHFYGSGEECQPVGVTPFFLVYMFPVTACGTLQTDEPGVIVYENMMYCTREITTGDRGTITRDASFDLLFQGRYTATSVEVVIVEVDVLPPPLPVAALGPMDVALFLGNGQCTGKGCVEEDVAFTSYYTDSDYPIVKVLRDSVYVEVGMLDRTDPSIVLTLGRCWVTADPNPYSYPQWDLLIDGCPNPNDNYRTKLLPTTDLPFPGHYRRFVFKMFAFMSEQASDPRPKVQSDSPQIFPLKQLMYIHCNTSVCKQLFGNTCEPSCYRKKRDIVASITKRGRPDNPIVSSKGIEFTSA